MSKNNKKQNNTANDSFLKTAEKLKAEFKLIKNDEKAADGFHLALMYVFVDIYTKCSTKPTTVGEIRAWILDRANATLDSIIDNECCNGRGGKIADNLVIHETILS